MRCRQHLLEGGLGGRPEALDEVERACGWPSFCYWKAGGSFHVLQISCRLLPDTLDRAPEARPGSGSLPAVYAQAAWHLRGASAQRVFVNVRHSPDGLFTFFRVFVGLFPCRQHGGKGPLACPKGHGPSRPGSLSLYFFFGVMVSQVREDDRWSPAAWFRVAGPPCRGCFSLTPHRMF